MPEFPDQEGRAVLPQHGTSGSRPEGDSALAASPAEVPSALRNRPTGRSPAGNPTRGPLPDSCQEDFDCKRCGHCCEGQGGIVVSASDLSRLCRHLGMAAKEFEARWGERRRRKLHIRTGRDGLCVFFQKGTGCGVHVAKPDICRAWPYFRGNLVDSESFALARQFCPGIPAGQSHAEFVRQGLAYLRREALAGKRGTDEAEALQVPAALDESRLS